MYKEEYTLLVGAGDDANEACAALEKKLNDMIGKGWEPAQAVSVSNVSAYDEDSDRYFHVSAVGLCRRIARPQGAPHQNEHQRPPEASDDAD